MADHFEQVKEFVLELGHAITREVPAEDIVIIDDEEQGIRDLVIDCEDEVLVIEQLILELDADVGEEALRRLLQINRDLVFGAFVLHDNGRTLLYRNTLALENLDLNELESTINALSLGLAENGEELLAFAAK